MLLVADALQQNLFLVALFLLKLGVELSDFARDRALFLQPFANLAVDIFIKLCRLLLDIRDFAADDFVEFCFSDTVRFAPHLSMFF